MTEFFLALGDFFTETFKVMPALGNYPNLIFTVVGIAFFVYWMIELFKYKKNDILE